MNILLVTDAWMPQMNGVVRTLGETVRELGEMGHVVRVVSPADGFTTVPLPTYPDISIALRPRGRVRATIDDFAPDTVHIATEGPLGWAARAEMRRRGWAFSTSYHTQFPEYIRARMPVPPGLTYAILRRFHAAAASVMVTTPSMQRALRARGFANTQVWARGVDVAQFHPGHRRAPDGVHADLPRPIWLNVGRVAVEKNLEAFLGLDLPGTKVVVGDGPDLARISSRFPDAVFAGVRRGDDLARHYADADVFVFPSRTDTFGLVQIEAMACGTPVAAFPVTGPADVIPGSGAGVMDEDLRAACLAALEIDRDAAARFGASMSWRAATERFVRYLAPISP